MGADLTLTRTLLQDMVKHPNAGGVLVLGLGCENNGLDGIKEYLKPFNRDNIEFFNCSIFIWHMFHHFHIKTKGGTIVPP